ncbi:MAG: hypothetical protein P8Y85_06195 [Nitrospirota bacterium]
MLHDAVDLAEPLRYLGVVVAPQAALGIVAQLDDVVDYHVELLSEDRAEGVEVGLHGLGADDEVLPDYLDPVQVYDGLEVLRGLVEIEHAYPGAQEKQGEKRKERVYELVSQNATPLF